MGEQFKIIEYPAGWCGKLSIMWVKLSNSGNALKLLVPSRARNGWGGWTNHLCMVISQRMIEREIGNRGSKSPGETSYKEKNRLGLINLGRSASALIDVLIVIGLSYPGVKEQRVDGSYHIRQNLMFFRYTLRGFERNSLVRIPSNKNINKRLYSTIKTSKESPKPCEVSIEESHEERILTPQFVVPKSSLNSWFITGFTDGDGSFTVYIAKKKTGIGWKVQPGFSIGIACADKKKNIFRYWRK